jgi:hypothetical protein
MVVFEQLVTSFQVAHRHHNGYATMASHSNASSSAFVAEYTAKELILYALAIGFGSSEKHERDELKFIYENYVHFSAVATFPLILPFWANRTRGTSQGI